MPRAIKMAELPNKIASIVGTYPGTSIPPVNETTSKNDPKAMEIKLPRIPRVRMILMGRSEKAKTLFDMYFNFLLKVHELFP
jgi:hypothetical protein